MDQDTVRPILLSIPEEVFRLLRAGRKRRADAMASGLAAYRENGGVLPMHACCPFGPGFAEQRMWWEHGWRRAEREAQRPAETQP